MSGWIQATMQQNTITERLIKGGLFSKAIFTEDQSRISNFPNFPTNKIGLIKKRSKIRITWNSGLGVS